MIGDNFLDFFITTCYRYHESSKNVAMDSTSRSEMDFNSLLSDAISNVDTLRHLQFQRKNDGGRKKGSRGPQAKVVKQALSSP